MSDLAWNKQGGLVPANAAELARARATDLGTLPPDICGTHCANCIYMPSKKPVGGGLEIGFCVHPLVWQMVSNRMCCAYWDAEGYLRP